MQLKNMIYRHDDETRWNIVQASVVLLVDCFCTITSTIIRVDYLLIQVAYFFTSQSILNPSNLYQYFCVEAYAVVSICISRHPNTAVEWMFIPPKNPVELPMEPGRNATNLAHERQSGGALGYFSLPNIL